MILKINSLQDINKTAIDFLTHIEELSLQKKSKIVAFYGKMGVGKTTFIKSLCKVLGVEDEVSSPTFSLINEYFTQQKESIFHFDFYRIESINEVYDFGYEDYFYSGKLCLIEWSELVEEILPPNFIKVEIAEEEDFTRTIHVS